MVSNLLRTAAIVCSLIIALSLLLFVIDQTKKGDQTAQEEIQGVLHPVLPASKPPGQPRKFIDQASHALTTPFNNIASGSDKWASRVVPAILGIILFGFGLGFLARVVSSRE